MHHSFNVLSCNIPALKYFFPVHIIIIEGQHCSAVGCTWWPCWDGEDAVGSWKHTGWSEQCERSVDHIARSCRTKSCNLVFTLRSWWWWTFGMTLCYIMLMTASVYDTCVVYISVSFCIHNTLVIKVDEVANWTKPALPMMTVLLTMSPI